MLDLQTCSFEEFLRESMVCIAAMVVDLVVVDDLTVRADAALAYIARNMNEGQEFWQKRIGAIKYYRGETGASLKTAKEDVDNLFPRRPPLRY